MSINAGSDPDFASLIATKWDDIRKAIPMINTDWVYRGQVRNWKLENSLERACSEVDIPRENFVAIENQLIRMFKRRYDGPDRQYVLTDSLYCMSLMQHHGGPTRLVDVTLSPFVACFIALMSKPPLESEGSPVVWCFNRHWFNERIRNLTGDKYQNTPNTTNEREVAESENRFTRYYRNAPPNQFVGMVDAFFLHPRIKVQQGIFLCQGDLSIGVEENLKKMKDFRRKGNIVKIFLKFSNTERLYALDVLNKMNVNEESLFPGLDGFCRSLRLRLPYLLSVDEEASARPPRVRRTM